MAKRKSLEDKLDRLRALRSAELTPDVVRELREAIADSSQIVVARAAAVAAQRGCVELCPVLAANFERLLVNPLQTDKTCIGKIAIAEALNELDYSEPEVFLHGVRHIQNEPVWGDEQDTAAPLRVQCISALTRIDCREIDRFLVDLLLDQENIVRVAAAQALGISGTEAAALLLRFKARIGDADAEVVGECLAGLLRINPQDAAPFVASFLKSGDQAIVDNALLALGNSRLPDAYEVIRDFWDKRMPFEVQETCLLALALLRLPAATELLISILESAPESTSLFALNALATLRHDPRVHDAVAGVVKTRENSQLTEQFARTFSKSN